jgi:hypothetical protein
VLGGILTTYLPRTPEVMCRGGGTCESSFGWVSTFFAALSLVAFVCVWMFVPSRGAAGGEEADRISTVSAASSSLSSSKRLIRRGSAEASEPLLLGGAGGINASVKVPFAERGAAMAAAT